MKPRLEEGVSCVKRWKDSFIDLSILFTGYVVDRSV